jgi:hypothetical protein
LLTRGLPRSWQLRGIDKKIAALKTELNYSTSGDRDQFLAGLSNLEIEKARLAQGAIRAQHDSESDRSRSRSPSHKDEELDATPPPSREAAAHGYNSESDDVSAGDADETSEPMPDSGELISPGFTVTQKELRDHFHLPLHTVAKKFGMCTTAFKKLCRRFGIAKWPHRQLRGIDKKIAALKAELNYSTVDKEATRRNLLKLEEEKARLSQGAEWTGLGQDLEGETTRREKYLDAGGKYTDAADASDHEQESSSRRVGIRNLLCEEEEEASSDSDSVHGDELKGAGEGGSALAGVAVTEVILREHFHLPLQLVAKKFGMCTTAFKKLCRRFGIAKWPHRQLRGIDKKIAALKAELNYSTVDKESARRNLVALEEEKARLSRVALLGRAWSTGGGGGGGSSSGGSGAMEAEVSKGGPAQDKMHPKERGAGLLQGLGGGESTHAGAKRKGSAGQDEPEAKSARRERQDAISPSSSVLSSYADASALNLLAAVAGIGRSMPAACFDTAACPSAAGSASELAQDSMAALMAHHSTKHAATCALRGALQLAPLHTCAVSGASSGSSSSISTPGLEPLSPAASSALAGGCGKQGVAVSPLLCSSAPRGGGAGGMGALLQSCAEPLAAAQGGPVTSLSLDSLRMLVSIVGGLPALSQQVQQQVQQQLHEAGNQGQHRSADDVNRMQLASSNSALSAATMQSWPRPTFSVSS